MNRNIRILLLSSIVLVAGAFWVGRASAPGRNEKPTPTQAAPDAKTMSAPSSTARSTTVAEASPRASQPAETPPLPPFGTPIAAMHDELAARARAGDSQAACRLGAELMRCRSQKRFGAVADLMKRSIDADKSEPSDDSIDHLVALQDMADTAGALCDGVTEQQMAEAAEFQRLAAERGNARMRLWYATDPALDREFFLRDFDDWQRYREVALRYMQQALEAGVPEAPAALAQIYTPSNGMFSTTQTPLRIADPHLYYVYRELASLLAPPAAGEKKALQNGVVDLAPKPGPDINMAQVRAEAEQLRQKWYSGYAPTETNPLPAFTSNDPQSICGQ